MRFQSLAVILLWAVSAPVLAQPPVLSPGEWPMDELRLRNGTVVRGLILHDGPDGVQFRLVKRPAGRPTVTLTTFFTKDEVRIDGIHKRSPEERQVLVQRLSELDSDGRTERRRMDAMTFRKSEWLGREGAARVYESDQFILVSAAPDEVTRRAALRLEQLYTAFARVLPPRVPNARPTRVELAGTKDEYLKLIKDSNVNVQNAAVFIATDQRIVCGSDLKRLGEELYRTSLYHHQQMATADKTERELRKLYPNRAEQDRFLEAIDQERAKIVEAERANEAAFNTATRKLFAILYHEAFHSYVHGFVYPPRTAKEVAAGRGPGELPRWLNEGLAQLFEDPILEAGELRVGHADLDRLSRVQNRLEGAVGTNTAGLLPLNDLLRAGREAFMADHASKKAVTDRTYLTSWGVAHHLTFKRRLIGTEKFETYLSDVNTGADPTKAFEQLVGQPITEYEKEWHAYLRQLQPDGTTSR